MEICRAFDIFEIVVLVIVILTFLFSFLLLAFNWTKEIKEIKKEFSTPKPISLIIMILCWVAIFFAYKYIKSMFC